MPEQSKIFRQGQVTQTKPADREFVRSVDVAVPEGFQSEGGPITRSGVIRLSMASGYSVLNSEQASVLNSLVKFNPDRTVDIPSNLYYDATTKEICLTSNTGGGGQTGGLSVAIYLSNPTPSVGETVTITGQAFDGAAPYTYEFQYSRNGSAPIAISGTGATRNFTFTQDGEYVFWLTATDNAGATKSGSTDIVYVGAAGSGFTIRATATATSVPLNGSFTWNFTATGGTAPIQWQSNLYVNGSLEIIGNWSTTAYRYVQSATMNGNYQIEVSAIDAKGNTAHFSMGATVAVGTGAGTASETTLYASATNTRQGSSWRGSGMLYAGAFVNLLEIGIDNVPGTSLNYGCIWFNGLAALSGKTIMEAKLTIMRGTGAGYNGSISVGAFPVSNDSASGTVITAGRTVFSLGSIGGYGTSATLDCTLLLQGIVANGWSAFALCDPMFPLDQNTRSSLSNCRQSGQGGYTLNYAVFNASGITLEIKYE